MSVTIKRKTGWIGSGSKLRLWLDGVETASIYEGREVEVDLPQGKSTLSATQLGVKSNRLQVESGDVIEITSTRWMRWSSWFALLLSAITGLFMKQDLSVRIGILVGVGVLAILSFRFINGLKLTRLERQVSVD